MNILELFDSLNREKFTPIGKYKIGTYEHELSEVPLSDVRFLAKFNPELKSVLTACSAIKQEGRLPIIKWKTGKKSRPFFKVIDPLSMDEVESDTEEEKVEVEDPFAFLK